MSRHIVTVAMITALSGCINVHTDSEKLPEALNVPAIKEAYQTKVKLQRNVQELKQIGRDLDAIQTCVSYQRFTIPYGSTDTVINSLIESTRSLRDSAKAILEKGPQYIEKVDSFAATLEAAPATFSGAAKLFRSFAGEEAYADVAEDYRQVAVLFENLATRTEQSQTKFRELYNREALLETLQYIRHQERFLNRLEAALYAQGPGLKEIEGFLHEIENYTSKFEQLRTQIRELNSSFRNLDDEPKPAKPYERAPAAPSGVKKASTVTRLQQPQQPAVKHRISILPFHTNEVRKVSSE
jgi:chromosome segregation ATPase